MRAYFVFLVGLALCGCGGGSGGGSSAGSGSSGSSTSGAGSGGTTGTTGAAPALVQHAFSSTPGNSVVNDSTLQFTAATKHGDTIWVAVTVSDYAGVHSIQVTDTQGNTFVPLEQENDGPPGSQSVAQFYASNIAGDTGVPDTVTIAWTDEDYKGVLIAEISGVTMAAPVGHAANIQDGIGAGTGNVTAGPIDVTASQTPALLVALSMNTTGGTSDLGGSGAAGPAAGPGLTQVAQLWDWGQNLATFATASVTGAESVTAAFDAPDTDSYVTVAAVFH